VIELLAGAGIGVAGYIAGQWLPRPHRKRSHKPPKPVRPICGCGHDRSYHDGETGQCHGLMDGDPLRYNAWNEPTAWKQVPCACRHYTGPEPLPSLYAPEITE